MRVSAGLRTEIPGLFRQKRATGPASLFVLSIDRLAKRELTSPPDESIGDLAPAISPDGQTVAFLRVTSGGVSDIYLVPFAGGEPSRLTFDDAWLSA